MYCPSPWVDLFYFLYIENVGTSFKNFVLATTLTPITHFIGTMLNLIYHVPLDMIPVYLVYG